MSPDTGELIAKLDDFAVELMQDPGPPKPPKTVAEFQDAHQYHQAFGSIKTSRSYWLLRENAMNHEAVIIARTLFERHINSLYAAKVPEHALLLWGVELKGLIEKLIEVDQRGGSSPGMIARIADEKKLLDRMTKLLGRPMPASLSMRAKLKEVGTLTLYQFYGILCGFVHGGLHSLDKWHEEPMGAIEWMAAITPMETALQWYVLGKPSVPTEVKERHEALKKECARRFLGKSSPPFP